MFVVDDIVNAGVGIFGKIWETRKLQQEADKWISFWSGQFFTFFISFNVVCGGALMLYPHGVARAIGAAQLIASARCIWAWRKSPITKDIVVALPNDTFTEGSPGSVTIDNTVTLGKQV